MGLGYRLRYYRTMYRLLAIAACVAAGAMAQPAPARIILVGDSTMAVKSGYGPGFCAHVTPDATCVNMAKGGRSTLSYRAEGSWDQVLAELNVRPSVTYLSLVRNRPAGAEEGHRG